jgi:hypothetical protein
MNKVSGMIKKNWWPISAILFCPCHLPLTMGILVALTAGTSFGAYLTANYTALESSTAVLFSFYFVIAFLIWAIRGPSSESKEGCELDTNGNPVRKGFSTKEILFWGIGSALLMPTLVLAGLFVRDDLLGKFIGSAAYFDISNSGFIWLISISTIVMIPVMVVWIAWMYVMWSKTEVSAEDQPEEWAYDYDAN